METGTDHPTIVERHGSLRVNCFFQKLPDVLKLVKGRTQEAGLALLKLSRQRWKHTKGSPQ